MRALKKILSVGLLLVCLAGKGQDTLSRDSLVQVIEQLRAQQDANAPAAATAIYPEAERIADSIELTLPGPRTEYERQKAEADRLWPWIMRGILFGAGIFIVWAYFYNRRYREEHTRNGVYYGIGSKWYHDHVEHDHYDGSRYGPSAGEDPWCYNEYYQQRRSIAENDAQRRKGGGASARW
ncbi:hypothetical protein [Flaviaesturariibacter terrae]